MDYPSLRRAKEQLITSRKGQQFSLRFYADELIEVKKRARLLGKTVSAYIRDCCLGEFVSDVFTENERVIDSLPLDESLTVSKPIERQLHIKANPVKDSSQPLLVVTPKESFEEKHAQDGPKKKSRDEILEIVSRKTGHKKFCNCFACDRLGAMIKDTKV